MFAECYFPRLSKSKKNRTVPFVSPWTSYECWKRSSRERPTSTSEDLIICSLFRLYEKRPTNVLTLLFSTLLYITAVLLEFFNIYYYFMGNCKKPRSQVKAMAGQLTLKFGMRSWKAPGKPGALFQQHFKIYSPYKI